MKTASESPSARTGQQAASHESLAEVVYERLLESIMSGELASGAPLSAIRLATTLDVSRTPIHEALRMLANDGFVELQTGRRAAPRG